MEETTREIKTSPQVEQTSKTAETIETIKKPEISPQIAQTTQKSKEDIIRERITQVVGKLLTEAGELAFELGEIDLEKCRKCPLLKRTLNMLKLLKQLRKELSRMRS